MLYLYGSCAILKHKPQHLAHTSANWEVDSTLFLSISRLKFVVPVHQVFLILTGRSHLWPNTTNKTGSLQRLFVGLWYPIHGPGKWLSNHA